MKSTKNSPSPYLPKWKIQEANWQSYHSLPEVQLNRSNFNSVIEAFDYLSNFIQEKAEECIPHTKWVPRRPAVPWWNKKCTIARKITRTCFRKYLRTHYNSDKISYSRALAKQKRIFKEAKRNSWKKNIFQI